MSNEKKITDEIKKLAKEENITFLAACSAMQSAAMMLGNDSLITLIHKIKTQSDEYKAIFN